MKKHILLAICAVSALAFFGCSKKQAAVQEVAAPILSENATSQSENTVGQETPSAEKDAWSDDDKLTIKELTNSPKGMVAGCTPGELGEAGLYMFTYIDRENDQQKTTLAPVIFASNSAKPALEKYPSFKRTDYSDMRVVWYASSATSVMAFHENDTPSNLITILYSTDKWNTWSESHIEADPDSLDDGIRVLLSVTCPIGETTGYLRVSYKLEKESRILQGGTIYRTQDLGKSWKRIEFPFGTEEYKDARVLSMSFEGKYGYVRFSYSINDEDGMKNGYFATKDGGETWVLWNNKRKMFVI